MLKKMSIIAACAALTACAGPTLESTPQYQSNYQLQHGVSAAQLTNQQVCDAIEPPYGNTYASAITEAQKRGLTKCQWQGYP